MEGEWKECDCVETQGSLRKWSSCISGHHSVKVMTIDNFSIPLTSLPSWPKNELPTVSKVGYASRL